MKEFKLKNMDKNVVPWTPEVVYDVYCNDNLEELPVKILEEMKEHLQNIIDKKGIK
jgi:hypothetical protein